MNSYGNKSMQKYSPNKIEGRLHESNFNFKQSVTKRIKRLIVANGMEFIIYRNYEEMNY